MDDDFKRPNWSFRAQAYSPAVLGILFLFFADYVWISYVKSGIPTDTLILAVTLFVIANSISIDLLLSVESSARRRRIRASSQFDRLNNMVRDHLLLTALVRMRACLPDRVTLRSVYDFNNSAFTVENLARRALEPLP